MKIIIKIFSVKITEFIKNYSSIENKDDLEKICYALQAIIGEFAKFLILFLFFYLTNNIDLFLFSFAIFSILRVFSGGFHCSNFTNCLLFTFLFFLVTCYLSLYLISANNIIHLIMLLISIIITVLKAPIPSKYRPIKDIKRYYTLKILSISSILIISIILLNFINNTRLVSVGILCVFFQSFQLLLSKGGNV